MDSKPRIPNPIIDVKEIRALSQLESKYNKLTAKNPIIKVGNKALEHLPDRIKTFNENAKDVIGEAELIKQAMKYAISGFQTLEEFAAQATVSERRVIEKVNKEFPNYKNNSYLKALKPKNLYLKYFNKVLYRLIYEISSREKFN